MKKVLFMLVLLTTVCGLTSCGVPQNVRTEEQEVVKIAQSIPLPPTFYSSDTGNKLVIQSIKVEFTNT